MGLPVPKRNLRIYDLLKMAGMSLDDWPHANSPNHNQRWAWLEGDIAVVNVWTDNIQISTGSEDTYTTSYQARGQDRKGKERKPMTFIRRLFAGDCRSACC